MKTLVTGGIRSGKSAYAEGLLVGRPVTYIATSAIRSDDPAWAERVSTHRQRRPEDWTTLETVNIADALTTASRTARPALLDDVGHWLTRTLDSLHAWDDPTGSGWQAEYDRLANSLVEAVATFPGELVIVTGEVGYGLVPPYASGRLYTDALGALNQRLAQVSDAVVLVACGCPLTLKNTTVSG